VVGDQPDAKRLKKWLMWSRCVVGIFIVYDSLCVRKNHYFQNRERFIAW
jgi:hypothetical protein